MLIYFHLWKDAMVWPRVAAGDSNDNVTSMPGITPLLNPQGNVSLQDGRSSTQDVAESLAEAVATEENN